MVKQKPASAQRSIVTKNLTSGRKEMRVATLNTVHRSRPDQAMHEHCYHSLLSIARITIDANYARSRAHVACFDCLPASVIVFVIVIIVAMEPSCCCCYRRRHGLSSASCAHYRPCKALHRCSAIIKSASMTIITG